MTQPDCDGLATACGKSTDARSRARLRALGRCVALAAWALAVTFTTPARAVIESYVASPMTCAKVVTCNSCTQPGTGHAAFNLDTATGIVTYYVKYSGVSGVETAKRVRGLAASCGNGTMTIASLPTGTVAFGTYGPIPNQGDMRSGFHYIDVLTDLRPTGALRAQIIKLGDALVKGACCLENGQVCVVTSSTFCGTLGGIYRGDNLSCAMSTGACNRPGGQCNETQGSICCFGMGSGYQGDGTTCAPTSGACCFGDGTCIIASSAAACTSQGGVFSGVGSTCDGAGGACCLGDGNCILVATAACCTSQGGIYGGNGSTCGASGACCLGGSCVQIEARDLCCGLRGGDSAGLACDPPVACRYPWGFPQQCELLDPECCIANGGTPECSQTDCTGTVEGCCFGYACYELDPVCCVQLGGMPGGPGSTCEASGDWRCCVDGQLSQIYVAPLCCALAGNVVTSLSSCQMAFHTGVCAIGDRCFVTCIDCCEGCFSPAFNCEAGPCSLRGCCLPDGSCAERANQECLAAGGLPFPEGSHCSGACNCLGDLSPDHRLNGADIQVFLDCFMQSGCACGDPMCPMVDCPLPCACADMDQNNKLDCADIGLFAQKLLTDADSACP